MVRVFEKGRLPRESNSMVPGLAGSNRREEQYESEMICANFICGKRARL